MRKYIDIVIFIITAVVVGFIVDTEEQKITSLENNASQLVIENNKLRFQLQKQCNTDIETVIELERVMKEMSGE